MALSAVHSQFMCINVVFDTQRMVVKPVSYSRTAQVVYQDLLRMHLDEAESAPWGLSKKGIATGGLIFTTGFLSAPK